MVGEQTIGKGYSQRMYSLMDGSAVRISDKMYFMPSGKSLIGTGIMPIQDILNAANELGSVEYVILEQDKTKLDQMESIKVSMESFKKFEGIDF